MSLTEKRVSSFEELHQAVQEHRTSRGKLATNTVYRGHKSYQYKLMPKIGRVKRFRLKKLTIGQKSCPTLADHEKRLLHTFQHRALPYVEREPGNDWGWMAIAQHFGLATRLLDWTRSPLVAAYFAVEEEYSGDSVVYAYTKGFFKYDPRKMNPFDIKGVKKIIPAHYSRRIEAQSGLFTLHQDPTTPLEGSEPDRLFRIVLDQKCRSRIRRTLWEYGFDRATLFPGLDGIAYSVNANLITKWI